MLAIKSRGVEIEVMDIPSKDVLVFTKQIRHWIVGDKTISGKKQFIFREDTPPEILKLYQDIKSKLEFAY
jgi:hypothetical protein